MFVQVSRPGQPGSEFAQSRGFPAPEVTDGIAVLAVPFRPLRREVANLVTTGTNVPRFGNELYLRNHGILLDEFEEGGEFVNVVELACQGGGEVEAEAVDVHFRDPVAEGVHQQLQGVRAADVQRVARTRVVHVVLLVIFHQAVIRGVVDALERQRGSQVVAFGGVVVHNVQDDFDSRGVQRTDHGFEVLDLLAGVALGAVAVVGREETNGVVAPVVVQALVLQDAVVDELVHRHQFDCGDPELLQVRDDRGVCHAGCRCRAALRGLPGAAGSSL